MDILATLVIETIYTVGMAIGYASMLVMAAAVVTAPPVCVAILLDRFDSWRDSRRNKERGQS